MKRLRVEKGSMLQTCPVLKMIFLTSFWRAAESRGASDAQPRFNSLSTYLPVSFQIQNAVSSFFLKEAGQEVMRNSSLQARTEPFFIHMAEGIPSVNCSYGNLSAEATVPLELLQSVPRLLSSPSQATVNWKIRAHIVNDRVHLQRPRVQTLFYLAGRSWDEASPPENLPCIKVFAFQETQEVMAGCRLEGNLGICVAELELLPLWFHPSSGVQGRKKASEQGEVTSVELYYTVQPLEGGRECSTKDPRKGNNAIRQGQDEATPSLQRIGSVYLTHSQEEDPEVTRLRLDDNIEIWLPSSPVKQGQVITFRIHMGTSATVDQFTLRALFNEGVNFLAVKPSDPAAWDIKQEVGPGSSAVTASCHRKSTSAGNRVDSASYEVLQVDFEIDNFISLRSTQTVTWQVEYPGNSIVPVEAASHVYVSQRELTGIVPLAEDTEVLNTAILTGRLVTVPVKVVTVERDGTVREVEDAPACRSTDEDVIKVSEACDFVLVNGREMRGQQGVRVNFTYLYLGTQLELTVWVPRLPLQIEVSDAELSQVKGWRVPIVANKRPTRESDDEEDDEKKGKGCTLQYQHAMVRVLTHFVAEPADPGGELVYMLGSDWQADITELVEDFFKVEDPRIARLQDGRVLIGKDLGITTIQVLSPLSDSILAEKTVTVLDDKVTITDLGVQLVAGLTLALQPSPGSSWAIMAIATGQELLHSSKQDAIISAWIQFSDGSVTPLNIYDPKDFSLSATSADEAVVSTAQDPLTKWPVVVAEGEGQGSLVRVEMVISEACQKSKRKSVLAVGNGNVKVKFGQNDVEQGAGAPGGGEGGGDPESGTGDRRQKGSEQDKAGPDGWKHNSASSDREEGAMRKVSTTTKTTITNLVAGSKPVDDEGPVKNIDLTGFPAQVDLPSGGDSEGDLSQTARGLSDLEIGMYALLGVFCLAILVFLINCVTFALKYRHKQVPALEQGSLNHAHDWVWLGNDAELLEHHGDPSPQQDECTTIIDRGEESKYLLNGGCQKNIQGQVHRAAEPGPCNGKELKSEPPNSPTSKRKRVKFTSFATVLPDDGGPYTNSILIGNEDDIKWVCQDMDLGHSTEIRTYMERLQDNL
ncbi:transmembrane protein 132C [Lepisosteus oculatus]|uniref:transmembrane protein 132C n=1 Tax=Lepisosteus oculatus TaxID=7918 RepID=UPI0035F5293C